MKKFGIIITIIIMLSLVVAFVLVKQGIIKLPKIGEIVKTGKIDDWVYKPESENTDFLGINSKSAAGTVMESSMSADGTIGLSTGGAKDINNFRENINNGFFPISTDITYNGLFYDYAFDTGKGSSEAEALFSPTYSKAISKDPISEKNEYYMTVGLNSNIKESDFKRKKLNLTVVLDISGSMSSGFNSYYYDNFTNENDEKDTRTKMDIANKSVNILIDQLKDDDRFGMVLFESQAHLGKPLRLLSETDTPAIKNHILEVGPRGGTNFEAGYKMATELYKDYRNIDVDEYENRIIIITDAMPNYGETSEDGLLSMVNNNAKNGIYTTFVGVGVDFNTKLIEEISNVRGANYYSVHSAKEFETRMGEQFEYMVTPLVFDLELNLKSTDFEIAGVYGSDTANKENGNLMKVNTLFPSKTTSDGEVKGGVILLKLNKLTDNSVGNIDLSVSYKDRQMEEHTSNQTITFNQNDGKEMYENTGIRKAIVLTRYANTLKNWILYERSQEDKFIIVPQTGIMDCIYSPEEIAVLLGEHERTSVKLSVSDKYKEIFNKIKNYMVLENVILKDNTLNKEVEILDKLIKL